MHRFSLSLGFAILFSLLFSMQVLAQREVLPAGGNAQGVPAPFLGRSAKRPTFIIQVPMVLFQKAYSSLRNSF